MASNCPYCGNTSPAEARFCMTCGRERPQPAAAASYSPTWVGPGAPPPAAPPAAAPGRSRALVWGGTLTAALVLGAGTTAGVLLLRDEGSRPVPGDRPAAAAPARPAPAATSPTGAPLASPAPARTAPSAAAPARPGTAGTGAPGGGDPGVPEGFKRVNDPAGFSFAIPSVWYRQKEVNGQITYAGSTGMSHLLVGVVRSAPYTSLENLTAIEARSRSRNADYRRLRLETNTFHGRPGAVWEYTYTHAASGETIHGIDQSYIAEDGTEYAIYFRERDLYWADTAHVFETALATWTADPAFATG
ncbi:zinc ribbon domain-containing protein [Streptomyces sp. NPDC049887]|uniref:zinc ribbon domain-containing protein n=1 Tax=unclassified Streptomyces TaxID=2593676 RepID=UPI00342AEBAA